MMVSAAYPNPVSAYNESVKIDLLSSCPMTAQLDIFTVAYRKIYGETVQVNGFRTVGWNLRDSNGSRASAGCYFIKVSSGSNSTTVKLILSH
jgi:hypothetical protein